MQDCRIGWAAAPAADQQARQEALLTAIVAGLRQREPQLAGADALAIDIAAAPAEADASAPHPSRGGLRGACHDQGIVLTLDAPYLDALEQDAGLLAAFVHRLHAEWLRLADARARSQHPDDNDAAQTLLADPFDRHFYPLAEAAWSEYRAERAAAWSLPPDADLMLPHLAMLCETLPQASAEAIALAVAEDSLDALFVTMLGRVGHLLQTAAHAQGALAGAGLTLDAVGADVSGRITASLLGARWPRLARALGAAWDAHGQWDARFLHNLLLPEVLALFAALGLDLARADDGSVWLAPRTGRLQ